MQMSTSTGAGAGSIGSLWLASLAQEETPPGEVVLPGNPAQSGTPTQGTPSGTPVGPNQPPQSLFGGPFMLVILLFLVVMILSSFMTQRREKKRREQLLGGIAKHDQVQTVGGIIGTVVEVRDDQIVLKVDENSNTRIRFARSAVQQVIKSAGSTAEPAGGAAKPS
jgi:preprotein translocase subunit YajC